LDKIGGFNAKKGDLDKMAKDLMGIPDGMNITLLTAEDMKSLEEVDDEVSPEALIQVQELMAYGENEFRQLASDKLLDELRIDPTLKDPERINEYTSTVTKTINDAKIETSKRMNERRNAIKARVEQEEKAKTEQYGKGGRFVSRGEQIFKSFEKGEINSANFQLGVNNIRNDAKTLASDIKIAPEAEKGPLTEAFFNLISRTGIGIDAVLTGEKSGVKIPTERIDWKTQPLFESRDEFENIRQEQSNSLGQGGSGGSLVDFVIREEAGPDGSSFYSTPSPDYRQNSIGYGTKARGPNDRVTPDEARKRLEEELEVSANEVNAALEDVGLILSQNELNAVISFHFNTGDGPNIIKKSGGDKLLIRNALSPINSSGGTEGQHVHVTRTPDGRLLAKPKVLRGLVDRRQREVDLFDGKFSQTPATKTKYLQLLEQMGIEPNTPQEKEFLENQAVLVDKLNFKP
jgi:GH24 family phage-related lysozyme (muramidase)